MPARSSQPPILVVDSSIAPPECESTTARHLKPVRIHMLAVESRSLFNRRRPRDRLIRVASRRRLRGVAAIMETHLRHEERTLLDLDRLGSIAEVRH
ncbi:hypothetical protein GCM10009777_39590 [Microbacterium pumilum]|uniref:Hemerythrin-like domain-containing protein n=1 Tax=Microbacterium pumilum TaxID=344165 RepID=A0ABN2T698_9MICO